MERGRGMTRAAAEKILRDAQAEGLIQAFVLRNQKTSGGCRSKTLRIEVGLVHKPGLFEEVCAVHRTSRGRVDWSRAYATYDRKLRSMRRGPKRALAKRLRAAGVRFGGEIVSYYMNRTDKILPVDGGYILNREGA